MDSDLELMTTIAYPFIYYNEVLAHGALDQIDKPKGLRPPTVPICAYRWHRIPSHVATSCTRDRLRQAARSSPPPVEDVEILCSAHVGICPGAPPRRRAGDILTSTTSSGPVPSLSARLYPLRTLSFFENEDLGAHMPLFFPLPFLPLPLPSCSEAPSSFQQAFPFPGFRRKKFFPVFETVWALKVSCKSRPRPRAVARGVADQARLALRGAIWQGRLPLVKDHLEEHRTTP